MDCPQAQLVDAYARGALSGASRDELERHIAGCVACRTRLAERTVTDVGHRETLARSDAGLSPTLDGEGAHCFVADELVADRYRTVRFVAEGGMGEVYEAEDRELRRRVALKTVRAEIAAEPRMLERFRREIALAHQVTHPNVCRIFDLGVHTKGPRISFLTMEFLDGETLAQRVRRRRLTTEEAMPLVEQLAAGLMATHAVGIVHRDFKSQNVMLVPTSTGTRAVITDFGLAGRSAKDGAQDSTVARGLVGSPAYMAPEQVAGQRADARTDLYAFGVVLFEMVTGALPFEGETPLRIAQRRLHEDAPAPRTLVPELDPVWSDVILRCLARDPTQRPADAAEVVRLLSAGPRRAARWPWAIAAAAIVAATVVTVLAWPHPAAPSPVSGAPTTPVAVTPVTAPPPVLAPPAAVVPRTVATPPGEKRPHRVKHDSNPQWNGDIVDAP